MPNNSSNDDPRRGTDTGRREERPRSTDGGSPTVTNRGDDRKTLLDKWGQRTVHVLLVIIPVALAAGLVLQSAGVHRRSLEFAGAFVGLALTVTGILAVIAVLYDTVKQSRQTELTEYESYK